jgi:hypothetical protein
MNHRIHQECVIQEYTYDLIFGDDYWKTNGKKQTLLLGAQIKIIVHTNFGHLTKTFIYKANLVRQPSFSCHLWHLYDLEPPPIKYHHV